MMSTSHPDNNIGSNIEGAMENMNLQEANASSSAASASASSSSSSQHRESTKESSDVYIPPSRMRSETDPENGTRSSSSHRSNTNYYQSNTTHSHSQYQGNPSRYPTSQTSYSGYRTNTNRYSNSGPNQYYRNQGGYPNTSYGNRPNFNDYNAPPPHQHPNGPPNQYHSHPNQGYRPSNVHHPNPSYGNTNYGMNPATSHAQWRGNAPSSSYPSNEGGWTPMPTSAPPSSSSQDQTGSWQPSYSNSSSQFYYSSRPNNGYSNPRANNWGTSGGSSYYGRPKAGQGHWDESTGHVIAARNEALEQSLFESVHVSTGINFNKYDDIPIDASGSDVPKMITSFKEANLDSLLCENIELAKYETPTPVQKYSLPIVEAGRDLMACAQTGSGKTAGFLFPILNELFIRGPPPELMRFHSANARQEQPICPMALILAPTRELTSQIYEEAKRFAYRSWVRPVVVYGGVPVKDQWYELRQGCALLVATPGRLNDLIKRGMISLQHVRYLVLDEADRMLDMGFEPQIRGIVEGEDMPPNDGRVTMMFSATFPKEIQYLARDFLSDYIFLSVGRVGAASDNVNQTIVEVSEEEKDNFLLDILHNKPASAENLVLIFTETKRMCDTVAYFLRKHNFQASAIHGDRDQREREHALESFRNAVRPILVATAVAARGLDIPNVTYVINYDLPNDIDDYVHRIGRTGRAGNPGTSITFFNYEKNKNVIKQLVQILRDANQPIPDFLQQYYNECMPNQQQRSYGSSGFNYRGGKASRGRGASAAHRDFRRDVEYASYTPSNPSSSSNPSFQRGGYYYNTHPNQASMNPSSSSSSGSSHPAGNDWGGWDGQKW